jgi:transcriptional regulator with XRE-family HTH domain
MTIRELVIARRNELNMTQGELSSKTKIPQSNISSFESGKRKMTSENLDKIFEALGIEFYNQDGEYNWDLAKECAKALQEKGIESIDKLTQEEVATLSGKEEILRMKNYSNRFFDNNYRFINSSNSYNYIKTLINFHLAMTSKK